MTKELPLNSKCCYTLLCGWISATDFAWILCDWDLVSHRLMLWYIMKWCYRAIEVIVKRRYAALHISGTLWVLNVHALPVNDCMKINLLSACQFIIRLHACNMTIVSVTPSRVPASHILQWGSSVAYRCHQSGVPGYNFSCCGLHLLVVSVRL